MTGTELEVRDLTPTLFGTSDPAEALERAAGVATLLTDFLHKQKLVVRIGQSDHVRVEGWTSLGSILGVFPVVVWTRPVMDGERQIGWEARVEARTRAGEVVGAGEAECLRTEKSWANRDDYALRSMAQTRAISKALRGPLGFIMQLSGFNPTPADEMPSADIVDAAIVDVNPIDGEPAVQVVDVADEKDKTRLNILVAKLRKADRDPTEWLYENYPRAGVTVPQSERVVDGRLRFSPLRDRLTRSEAKSMVAALDGYVKNLPKASA